MEEYSEYPLNRIIIDKNRKIWTNLENNTSWISNNISEEYAQLKEYKKLRINQIQLTTKRSG